MTLLEAFMSMVEPPDISAAPLTPPFFLRQLRPTGGWGDPRTPIDVRIPQVVHSVFLSDQAPYSLWCIHSNDDFRRAVMALYCGRTKPTGPIAFLPIESVDLERAGISVRQTDGNTKCILANRTLHFDAEGTPDQMVQLCRQLIAGGRDGIRLKEKPLLV